jgi:short subunit dehydrogenase-like uncharacterized protein
MADILLFGATGFTGRLTATALARRGASFAIAGRNRTKLEQLSQRIGGPEVHVARAGDVDSLVRALKDTRVLISCVGPFVELGDTAAQAAIQAGVNYLDSTGEAVFVNRLIEEFDASARKQGLAMAPALGFDEVPADVGLSLAYEGFSEASAVVTYAAPTTASRGTFRSSLQLMTTYGWRVDEGQLRMFRAADRERWAPMPPPLGVRRSVSAPMAIGRLAPLHFEFESLDTFVTTGTVQRPLLKAGLPLLTESLGVTSLRKLLWKIVEQMPEGPTGDSRQRLWTVLVEVRAQDKFRNIVIVGRDVYGLTAELLAAGAIVMSHDEYRASGVLAPVPAIGLETLQKELENFGVTIQAFEPV